MQLQSSRPVLEGSDHRLKRREEAMQAFHKALELNPLNVHCWQGLAAAAVELGDFAAAEHYCRTYCERLYGEPWNQSARGADLLSGLATLPILPADKLKVSRFKLTHDYEQLGYLLSHGKLPEAYRAIEQAYRIVLDDLSESAMSYQDTFVFDVPEFHQRAWQTVKYCHNRPLYIPTLEAPSSAPLNPDIDFRSHEDSYMNGTPRMTVIDDFLSPDVLDVIRRFCLEATIWFDIRHNYLGAYRAEGFYNPVIIAISEALRKSMPEVFGEARLSQFWAYKYGADYNGIKTHADSAAVNVNFWIAPEEANLDKEHGGLEVFSEYAPEDWDFHKYNRDRAAIDGFLAEHGNKSVVVPHRENRALVFDSRLFHKTDTIRFRDDYESRRVNITLLFK